MVCSKVKIKTVLIMVTVNDWLINHINSDEWFNYFDESCTSSHE